MKKNVRNWSATVTLGPSELACLRSEISAEIDYYNHLLAVFSTRVRVKPEFIKSLSGPFEAIVAYCASAKTGLRHLDPRHLPRQLAGFAVLLFDADGKSRLTDGEHLFFDQIGAKNPLDSSTRSVMAVEMLRFHRAQATAFTAPSPGEFVYRSAIETLTPIDAKVRRHVQVPRKSVTMTNAADGVRIKVPFLAQPVVVSGTIGMDAWTILVLRDDGASVTAEFLREADPYLLRKKDPRPSRARNPE